MDRIFVDDEGRLALPISNAIMGAPSSFGTRLFCALFHSAVMLSAFAKLSTLL